MADITCVGLDTQEPPWITFFVQCSIFVFSNVNWFETVFLNYDREILSFDFSSFISHD